MIPHRTEEPQEPGTELCISKLNSKERCKFSLERLAEALDEIDKDEDDTGKMIMDH